MGVHDAFNSLARTKKSCELGELPEEPLTLPCPGTLGSAKVVFLNNKTFCELGSLPDETADK